MLKLSITQLLLLILIDIGFVLSATAAKGQHSDSEPIFTNFPSTPIRLSAIAQAILDPPAPPVHDSTQAIDLLPLETRNRLAQPLDSKQEADPKIPNAIAQLDSEEPQPEFTPEPEETPEIEPDSLELNAPEVEADEEPGERWQIEIQPTLLIPFRVQGEATVEGLFQLDQSEILEGLGTSGIEINIPDNVDVSDLENIAPELGESIGDNIGIQSVDFDLDVSDILNLDRALRLSGRVQAWRGKLGLIFDGQYSQINQGGEFSIGPLEVVGEQGNIISTETADFDVELDVEQAIFDLAVSYRVFGDSRGLQAPENLTNQDFPRFFAEPIAGVRIGHLAQDLDIDPGPEIGFDDTYAEPLLGARLGLQVSPSITLGLRGDVSGFGIGSDVTWNLLAGLDWRFSRNVSLRAAYRIYELVYDTEEDGREFDVYVQEQGIWLGFKFYL